MGQSQRKVTEGCIKRVPEGKGKEVRLLTLKIKRLGRRAGTVSRLRQRPEAGCSNEMDSHIAGEV